MTTMARAALVLTTAICMAEGQNRQRQPTRRSPTPQRRTPQPPQRRTPQPPQRRTPQPPQRRTPQPPQRRTPQPPQRANASPIRTASTRPIRDAQERGSNERPGIEIPQRPPIQPALPPRRLSRTVDFAKPSRQEFRDQFQAQDYVFDLLGRDTIQQAGGNIRACDVADLPSLYGEGTAMTIFTIEPCAINLPHVHPRGTEILYVIRGDNGRFLQTAFVEPNGGRVLVANIGVGELVFFPEGLLHYQQNLGCVQTQYLSGLNSEDPGVSTISFALFDIPTQGLQATLNQGEADVDRLVRAIPEGPAAGQLACRRRCGLV